MNDTTQTTRRILLSDPPTLRERVAALWQGLGNAWERLRAKVFIWRHTGNQSAFKALSLLALAAVLLVAASTQVTCSQKPAPKPEATQPAAVQTNPLAPLAARMEALEAQVADLQEAPPYAAPWPAQRRAPASAPAAPAAPVAQYPGPQAPPAPAAQPWGTTDLDRAIALHKPVIPELFPTNTTGAQQ